MIANISFLVSVYCGFLTMPILWISVLPFVDVWGWECFVGFIWMQGANRPHNFSFTDGFVAVSFSHSHRPLNVYLWAYIKLACQLWSRISSLAFNCTMHIKQLGAIFRLGFIQKQIEVGSACCLEKGHEKEYCHFQTWTHTVKGYVYLLWGCPHAFWVKFA